MPKAPKQPAPNKPKSLYSTYLWECRHHQNHSEIIAYAEASGDWETIAEVRPTSGASAEMMATFICNLINQQQYQQELLQAAVAALQTCLEEDKMTFASEHAADSVLTRIQKVGL